MTGPMTIFGSAAFARALAERPLVALDIGARRGFIADLLPIAAAVDAIGFEPDEGECDRLNRETQSAKGPWRSLRFIAAALAGEAGRRDLHLTRHGGTSSMLAAIPGIGARYMRDDYFAVERTVTVDTLTLDDTLARFGIDDAAYMKVDVEGMEKAIFEGGSRTLDHVLAVRTEVAFMRTRHDQPLHHEIDALLQGHGLLPFGFVELHEWRRTTRRKHSLAGERSIPFSRGRLVHGDVIYSRDVETMDESGDAAIDRMVQLAALALCYDFVDEAAAIMRRGPVAESLKRDGAFTPEAALKTMSCSLARRYRRRRRRTLWRSLQTAAFTEHVLTSDTDGAANPWHYEMPEPGLNYRASDIHCALGLSQLGKLDRFVARRRALTAKYDTRIAGLGPLVRPLARRSGCAPAWHLYVVLIDFAAAGTSRRRVMEALRADGIGSQVHYIPVHRQPYYRERYGEPDLPGAMAHFERCLSLPLFPTMADGDVDRVVDALARALGR